MVAIGCLRIVIGPHLSGGNLAAHAPDTECKDMKFERYRFGSHHCGQRRIILRFPGRQVISYGPKSLFQEGSLMATISPAEPASQKQRVKRKPTRAFGGSIPIAAIGIISTVIGFLPTFWMRVK